MKPREDPEAYGGPRTEVGPGGPARAAERSSEGGRHQQWLGLGGSRTPVAGGPVVPGLSVSLAGKTSKKCLKEMEVEMTLLKRSTGSSVTRIPTAVPVVPMVEAMQVPAAPMICPMIATNVYQQVQQTMEAQAAAAATVVPSY